MRGSLFIVGVLLAAATTGCSKHEEEKPTSVIPDYQQKALQQAKDVEKVLNDAEKKHRDDMDAQ